MANVNEKKETIEIEVDEETLKDLQLKLLREQKTVDLWFKERVEEYLDEQ